MIKYSAVELKEILDKHKLYLEDVEGGERADLRCADLRRADLRDADLRRADLRDADLRDADLRSANLRYADLRDADLRSANLRYADLRYADLRYADLSSADLRSANLSAADLSYADLDYSVFPLWCGGLHVNLDDRIATQLLYHLVSNVLYSKNTSKQMKKLCKIKSIILQANKFHRVSECGKIDEKE